MSWEIPSLTLVSSFPQQLHLILATETNNALQTTSKCDRDKSHCKDYNKACTTNFRCILPR